MTESTNQANAGVNREEAKSILKRFFENENYRVLAVNGKWGIGKTHLVQTFLEEHHKNYYLYASVFGISSIEQLKARLIANNQSSQGKTESIVSSANKSINKFIFNIFEWFKRISQKLEKTPKLDLKLSEKFSIPITGSLMSIAGDLALEILFNLNVRENSIICIDDLERKSKLPLDEILGFVEYLAQELKCKVVLIYNEDNLAEIDKKALQDYREKVIDREFKLDPTVEENLVVGLKDIHNLEHRDLEVFNEVFIKAGTNNIRVIKKTGWLIKELIPLMKNWEDSLRHQIIRNCIIINLAKIDTDFCKHFSITIDTILSLIDSRYADKNNDNSENRTVAINLLSWLGYNIISLDKEIIQLVETSLYISDTFIKKGEFLNQRELKDQIIQKLYNIEGLFYISFADNEQEIVHKIEGFIKEHHLDLSISEFERIEKLAAMIMMKLDISSYERSLLEKLLKEHLERYYYDDFNSLRVKLHKYPDLEICLQEKKNHYQQTLNISTALSEIIRVNNQLSSLKLEAANEFINNCTVDEFSKWLQNGDSDLYLMVKKLLRMDLPASKNLEQAIRRLAAKSDLNKNRAKYLYNIDIYIDIDIDNPSNSDDAN
ncbi:hypothetical protein B6N60_02705 [Richelia sinica FACHB-800]|uniref:KAP NTPase domain-containing protein n=1 Tax=Richelia sinica FACHB-800 TaxID=1357546 RepID=A0A975T873_9NOST|nr:P-loop NTPase fold protein [Richelia sinica]MBD2665892.1 hypothetical protein [Richelia sinica FACHB-800]QXE24003.1 hypothetical protein B6N60_02705 [Richelia sinica FACHB-800]